MNILIDEGPGQRWTLSRGKAAEKDNSAIDYHDFSHWNKLLTGLYDCREEDIHHQVQEESIAAADIIILPDPFFGENTRTDLLEYGTLLKERVLGGASLLLLGEYHTQASNSHMNMLANEFGIYFGDDSLSFPGPRTSIAYKQGECNKSKEHVLTQRSPKITVFGCVSVDDLENNYTPLYQAPCGRITALAGNFGQGRVLAMGDSDMFSNAFLGSSDNFSLLVDSLAWLGKREVSDENMDRLCRIVNEKEWFPTLELPKTDVKVIVGEHVFDAAPYYAQLKEIVDSCNLNPYQNQEVFFEEVALAFSQLPKAFRKALYRFKRKGNGLGVFVVRGLPTDENPGDTPSDCSALTEKPTFRSEFWLTIIATYLGEIYAFKQEKSGNLFQNLCPTKGNEWKIVSESSKGFLDFHTEAAFHPDLPDYVMLYCVRGDHQGKARTLVSHVNNMLPKIPVKVRSLLSQRLYRTGVDFSFGSANGQKANGPLLPILSGNPYKPYMNYDLDLMQGITEEAEKALIMWRDTCRTSCGYVQLEAGDLGVVDNRFTAHARSSFTPKYDGQDRWLQRVCVIKNLDPSADSRIENCNVIDTSFNI